MKCPKCGSTRVAPIIYGLPDGSEELMRKLDNEEVFLGGCLIFEGYPEYHCFECDANIGRRPVFRSEGKLKDYRLFVTGIRFTDEGFPQLLIEKRDGKIVLEIRPPADEPGAGDRSEGSEDCGEPGAVYSRVMTEEEWKALLDKLYTELHIHEWNSIFITRNYAEGEKWELEILFTEDRVIKYKGFGGFPPYWEELKELLRGLETGGLQ